MAHDAIEGRHLGDSISVYQQNDEVVLNVEDALLEACIIAFLALPFSVDIPIFFVFATNLSLFLIDV